MQLFYTCDGSEPNSDSNLYTKPISITGSVYLKAIVYRNGVKGETYSKKISFNNATVYNINLKNEPDSRYTFNGAITLVDGQSGYKESCRTGSWIGF